MTPHFLPLSTFLFVFLISDPPFGGTARRGLVTHVGTQALGGPVRQPVVRASSLGRWTVSTRGAARRWLRDAVSRERNPLPGGTAWGLPVIVRTPLRYCNHPEALCKLDRMEPTLSGSRPQGHSERMWYLGTSGD